MSESVATGEEFRDDMRIRRALSPEVLGELTRLDPVRSTFSVLTTLAVIAATVTVALTWREPWTIVPAVIVIATQQHACFVLAHDAAHYRLFRTRWLNELVGRGVAIAPGVSMCTYRVVHRLHHNHVEHHHPAIPTKTCRRVTASSARAEFWKGRRCAPGSQPSVSSRRIAGPPEW